MGYLKMNEVQGKFRVVTEGSLEEVIARLKNRKARSLSSSIPFRWPDGIIRRLWN